jgi:hypothetical protein
VTYYPEDGDVPTGVEAVWTPEGERAIAALKKAGIDFRSSRGATRGGVPLELRIGRK